MKDLKCCLWDESLQVCLMVESMRSPFTISRMLKEKQLEMMFRGDPTPLKTPPSKKPPGMYLKMGEKRKINDKPSE